jgi:hypothetical protein
MAEKWLRTLEATVIGIEGGFDGDATFDVNGMEITCFLPDWSKEGWVDREKQKTILDEIIRLKSGRAHESDEAASWTQAIRRGLIGTKVTIALQFLTLSGKTSKREKTLELIRRHDPEYNFVGEIIDAKTYRIEDVHSYQRAYLVDCGLPVHGGGGWNYKIGDYVEGSSRLDAHWVK